MEDKELSQMTKMFLSTQKEQPKPIDYTKANKFMQEKKKLGWSTRRIKRALEAKNYFLPKIELPNYDLRTPRLDQKSF
jgi:hypothetical protein